MLAACARRLNTGIAAVAARAPSNTRREIELEREDEYVMTEPLPELLMETEIPDCRLTDVRDGSPSKLL
jgi:hypothetical protein